MIRTVLAHLRAQWAGFLALSLVLAGGTAYAANTVFSADITDGEVKSVDIGDRQVQAIDVRDRSLRGADLGVRVRGEKQVNDGSGGATCGQGTDFDECITVNFTVPRPQRLLLVGSGEWTGSSFTPGGTNSGECRFSIGALQVLGLRKFGEVGASPSGPFNFAMNSVTGVLDQGFYEIGIDCRRTSDASSGITVRNTELSVAALGDG
jgi:hypothetical protein